MNGEIHPESDYEEMARLGAKLGIPVPMMHLGVQVKKPDGAITHDSHDRSRTWVRNFWNDMITTYGGSSSQSTTYAAGSLGTKSTNGALFSLDKTGMYAYTRLVSGNANSSIGIVVGSGTTAESFEHYMLANQVVHGTSTNQLFYAAQNATIATYNASTKTWTMTIVRQFTNNSSAAISITETGIIYTNASASNVLFCRDLLSPAVNVPVGSVLTITYSLTLNFPA